MTSDTAPKKPTCAACDGSGYIRTIRQVHAVSYDAVDVCPVCRPPRAVLPKRERSPKRTRATSHSQEPWQDREAPE